MFPCPSFVFPCANCRGQPRLRNSEPDVYLLLLASSSDICYTNFTGQHVVLRRSASGNGNAYLFISCCLLDGLLRLAHIVAAELLLPVHNHLRSIRAVALETTNILLLPDGPFSRRIRIRPAVVIPIIHVLFEPYNLSACNWLVRFQFIQQRVCGRATGATFRSE